MKKNMALFTGVVSFVLLFYKQDVALNLSIFSLLVWLMLFLTTEKQDHTKIFWWLSSAVFVAAAGFAWYGDFASFVPLFFSVLVLGFKTAFQQLNILTFPIAMPISYITSPVRVFLLKKWLGVSGRVSNFWSKFVSYFLIPVFFLGIFLALYRAASDKFASFLTIDWNFDLLQLVFLTAFGFFLMFNFFHLMVPGLILKENQYLRDNFSKVKRQPIPKENFSLNINFQRRSGEISLILLNLVLLFFIIVYASESIQNLTPERSYSSEVHERVYVIIASIVIAVAIIMIYFSSPFNFGKDAKLLRSLSYVWITLNAVLVIISMLKTGEYVNAYGLTFRRIGVYAFLLLSLAGLVITSYKLMFVKTNIYLLNRMVWVFFFTMIVGFNINWSWVVTKYNTSYQKNPDIDHLKGLNFNRGILYEKFGDLQLQEGSENKTIKDEITQNRSKPFLSRNLYYQFLNIEK